MSGSSKDVAIVASAGRTGTTFFAQVLADIIEDSFSVHEPDLLDGISMRSWQAIRTFGVYHMTIGRIIGHTGIRNLSQKFVSGKISLDELVAAVRRHRCRYYASIRQSYIIESYYQWYGILPAIPVAFSNAKILCIVRDPRTWVTSWMNFGGHFDAADRVTRLGFKRLEPGMSGDEETARSWRRMSAFEKNCWHWRAITELLLAQTSRAPECTRLYRFEDLFLAEDRDRYLRDVLEFLVRFPNRCYRYRLDPDVLDKVSNPSKAGRFPSWLEWTPDMARQLDFFCGPLMQNFGYGDEREWKEKLSSRTVHSEH